MSADELPAGDDMLDAADEQRHDAACGVSDIPEIERLRRCAFQRMEDDVDLVPLSSAESAIRTALDRQAREIVEYVESLTDNLQSRGSEAGSVGAEVVGVVAAGIRARFAPKEADPR